MGAYLSGAGLYLNDVRAGGGTLGMGNRKQAQFRAIKLPYILWMLSKCHPWVLSTKFRTKKCKLLRRSKSRFDGEEGRLRTI